MRARDGWARVSGYIATDKITTSGPQNSREKREQVRASKLKELEKWLLGKRKGLLSGVRAQASNLETAGSGTLDLADQAANAYTKEFLLSLGDADRRLLRQVDGALEKIRLRTYGKCEKCEGEITVKRLEAVPFAEYCISCQEEEERQ